MANGGYGVGRSSTSLRRSNGGSRTSRNGSGFGRSRTSGRANRRSQPGTISGSSRTVGSGSGRFGNRRGRNSNNGSRGRNGDVVRFGSTGTGRRITGGQGSSRSRTQNGACRMKRSITDEGFQPQSYGKLPDDLTETLPGSFGGKSYNLDSGSSHAGK